MNIEDLIAEANPVPHGSLAAPDSPQARQTLARVLNPPAPYRRTSRRRTAGGRRPAPSVLPRIALGGAAVAGAAGLVLTQVLPGSPARPSHPSHSAHTASAVLGALAAVAAAQPAEHPPGPGQFQYTGSKSLTESDTYDARKIYFRVNYSVHRQIWIGLNGSGRLAETFRDPRFLSPGDRARWIAAGRPSLRVPPSDDRFGPHGLSLGPTNLLKLPTNPARLRALLVARKIEGGPEGPAEDFVQVGDLLRETDAPPALRAALFKVAARIPGVRLLGTVTDQAGRSGIGLAYFDHFTPTRYSPGELSESVLIFDPKTSKLLAEQQFLTPDKTKKTSLIAWTVYLVTGVVNSITSTTPVKGTSGGGSGPA